MIIQRDLSPKLMKVIQSWPSITLTGPRQSGKTTLCRNIFPNHPYESLEAPDIRAFATEDPRAFLTQFPQGAVFDEIQRVPELFSYLQGIIDKDPTPGRWVFTGSQNLSLLDTVKQSLAGRTVIFNLLPLTRNEIILFPQFPATLEESLYAGSFPRVFDCKLDPVDWNRSYVATYIERDVKMMSDVSNLATFQRFLALCAGRTGQLLNYSSLAGDCGISQPTAKAWINILEASFVVFRLPAFRSNFRKRLVKNPKLHFYDTGLVCWLLGIRKPEQLLTHPLRGSIFETWVVSEIVKRRNNHGEPFDVSFYRDQNGAEIDLVVEHPEGIKLVEAKSTMTASPNLFNSSNRVLKHLTRTFKPCSDVVIYGGDRNQQQGTSSLVSWRNIQQFDWLETA